VKILLPPKVVPYILVGFSLLAIYGILWRLTPQRVGDGGEYYGLFCAWSDTLRPWMTDKAFASYELLALHNNISGLPSRELLWNAFPSLRVGGTADFNHFWFYSFLAFGASKLLAVVGMSNGPHQSFLALHFLLILSTVLTAFYFYRWRGLVAMLAMTFASPMLWFFDKVHTELFTYCTVLLATFFICEKKYLASAFMLAIAATQNPSFAIIAFIPFFYRLVVLRKENFTVTEVALAIGVTIAALAHPIYYFARFGVPTPQLLAGGASLGGNISSFYIWLLDPDLGLLTNWPFGLLAVLFASIVFFKKREHAPASDKFLRCYLALFFLVNFYAHSSTTNLNSGATPGVARYSLWYLPAFFPLVLYVIDNFPKKKFIRICGLLILTSLMVVSGIVNNPRMHEDYSTPNRFSSWIQNRASFLYNPPPEVFAERYSGIGESILAVNPEGVLGPDCKKLLLYPGHGRTKVISAPGCFIDSNKIQAHADRFLVQHSGKDAFYVRLDEEIENDISAALKFGEYSVGQYKDGNQVLKYGWSLPEPWGVWTDGGAAVLSFPCNSKQFYFNRGNIRVGLLLQPFGGQKISIDYNGVDLYKGVLNAVQRIDLNVNFGSCEKKTIDLHMSIAKPRSPLKLGNTADARMLGVGLIKFTLN
jgi:hypothetical protein